MKSITYFILLILIVSISTEENTCEDMTPSKDNCKKYTNLTADEKEEGDSCCYFSSDDASSEGGKYEECEIFKKSEIENTIKSLEASGYSGVDIVCSSNWLIVGFSFLLLVLFF